MPGGGGRAGNKAGRRERCDREHTNLRGQDSRRIASAVLCARHGAVQQACTRSLCGRARTFHCRARPIRISNLSTQTVAQQAMGCQYGVWMGAAKADEARRRVRTSAIAPPCVPLEGGATIICATPERRACFERATEPWKSAKCRHCYTNSKCTHPAVLYCESYC